VHPFLKENDTFMRRPSEHAMYLRAKAGRFRELAGALHGSISAELLNLAAEMESVAAEMERGSGGPAAGAVVTPAPRAMRNPLDERRLILRVLHHWTEMAIAQRFPSRDNIDPWLVGNDWANCMMLMLNPDKKRFKFYVVGANLLAPGQCLDGASIADCPDGTVLADMIKQLDRCIADAAPVVIEGATAHLGTSVQYRAILMPLSDDGETVNGIFGAASFKKLDR
jgi:hypothetical protein